MIDIRPYLPRSTGDEPLRFRYVNQGSDWRLGGPVGLLLGGIQRASMFYSTQRPWLMLRPLGSGHIAVTWPPFFSLHVPKANGRYVAVRLGWRYDPNVGDGVNPREPTHDPPGAYFFDWWLRPDAAHVAMP